jgi:hypothetical protein
MPKGIAFRLYRWFYFLGLCMTVAAWCPRGLAQSAEEMMGSVRVTVPSGKAQLMARH